MKPNKILILFILIIIALPFVISYNPILDCSNALAIYNYSEGSGSAITDYCGLYNATITDGGAGIWDNQITPTNDSSAWGSTDTGSNDYAGSSVTCQGKSECSFEVWVNWTASSGSDYLIDGGGRFSLYEWTGAYCQVNNGSIATTTKATLTAGQWVHLACVKNTTHICLYKDGAKFNCAESNGAIVSYAGSSIAWASGRSGAGIFDYARFYDGVLKCDPSEIIDNSSEDTCSYYYTPPIIQYAPIIEQINFSSNISVNANNNTQIYVINATDQNDDNMTCTFYWNDTLDYTVQIDNGEIAQRTKTMPAISEPISQYWNCSDGTNTNQTPIYYVTYQFTNVSITPFNNITTQWTDSLNQSVTVTEPDGQSTTCYLNDSSVVYVTSGTNVCNIIGNYSQGDVGVYNITMNVTDGDSWDSFSFILNITESTLAGGTCQISNINTFSTYNLGYTASISAKVKDNDGDPLVFSSCNVVFFNSNGDPVITEPYLSYVKSTYGGAFAVQYNFLDDLFDENEVLTADISCMCHADNDGYNCYNEVDEALVGFYSCHYQTNITLGADYRQPGNDRFFGLIFSLTVIMLVFGFIGYRSDIYGIQIFGYGIALTQLLMIGFIIYNNELRNNFISILRIEFIALLLLGFIITMIAGINFIMKLINPESKDQLEEKKWGR